MPDYNNTCIYKICCKDTNITDIYVGHTTDFYNRKHKHKSTCNNENSKNYFNYIYYIIRENGGWDNWEMIKLYHFPCESRTDAEIEERKCYEKLGAKLNSYNPHNTVENLKENNIQYCKKYREKYRDIIKEKKRIKKNCSNCNKLISTNNIQAHMKSKKCQSFNQT